jgi:hypothetical protein
VLDGYIHLIDILYLELHYFSLPITACIYSKYNLHLRYLNFVFYKPESLLDLQQCSLFNTFRPVAI